MRGLHRVDKIAVEVNFEVVLVPEMLLYVENKKPLHHCTSANRN